jgi:hypothetical protein
MANQGSDGGRTMASVPTRPTAALEPAETTEQRFRRLEATWTTETGHLSSTTKIVNHPAFREIVGMGEAVLPLMFRDLRERPQFWVWALPEITGADPVPAADRGNIARMTAAWLDWAQANEYQ